MLRSLRTQIIVWTILPLAILLIGIAYLGVSNHQSAMRELVAERDGALARVAAARISELLTDRARDLENLDASHPETWDTQIFEGGIALLDANRRIVSALPTRETWEARRDKIARKDEFSKPFLENGAWLVLLTHPNQDGTLVAAVQLPDRKSVV